VSLMEKTIYVHCVHGTWAYGFLNCGGNKRRWFQPGSPFILGVRSLLPDEIRDRVRFVRFRWSGRNSIAARNQASEQFCKYLSVWKSRAPAALHLILAHSHGGTVVIDALRETTPVDGVLTMATPFLSFHPIAASGWQYTLRYGTVATLHLSV